MRAEDILAFIEDGSYSEALLSESGLCMTAVNELVIKFERIVGSDYYSVKPEMRAPEVSAPSTGFQPEPASGSTTQSRGAVTTAGHPSTGPPQAANNALQQLLYQRPQQVRTPKRPIFEPTEA